MIETSEVNLPGLGKSHPESKDELEGVVEGYEVLDCFRLDISISDGTYGTNKRR